MVASSVIQGTGVNDFTEYDRLESSAVIRHHLITGKANESQGLASLEKLGRE